MRRLEILGWDETRREGAGLEEINSAAPASPGLLGLVVDCWDQRYFGGIVGNKPWLLRFYWRVEPADSCFCSTLLGNIRVVSNPIPVLLARKSYLHFRFLILIVIKEKSVSIFYLGEMR